MENTVVVKAKLAKEVAMDLANLNTAVKNQALNEMAQALWEKRGEILAANALDIEAGKANNLSTALLDRLLLTEDRIAGMANGLRQIVALADPVGKTLGGMKRPNGLQIYNVQVPIGVIGIIYEARPNVTVDAIGLCIKSGNCVILRGGKEAIHSNSCLAKILGEVAYDKGIPQGAIQFIEDTKRENIGHLLSARDYVDVIIPRGGKGLINYVVNNALVPVIETGAGVCHVYVDRKADFDLATKVIINAKVSRPAVCNAIETVLVHEEIADQYLPQLIAALRKEQVAIRGDEKVASFHETISLATEEDWAAEYGDLILAVKVVKDVQGAVKHIATYGSHHSEAIITTDYNTANYFQGAVDAAAVYVNASTRFTDGEEFGFGGEIGISTQKLHVRGPMGLDALTTNKYLIMGEGQIR